LYKLNHYHICVGNKRVAKQSCDQTLTRMNKALARNCDAKLNAEIGATAKDWKEGIPVRVVRSSKLKKHSKYAPAEGNRYLIFFILIKMDVSAYRICTYMLCV